MSCYPWPDAMDLILKVELVWAALGWLGWIGLSTVRTNDINELGTGSYDDFDRHDMIPGLDLDGAS